MKISSVAGYSVSKNDFGFGKRKPKEAKKAQPDYYNPIDVKKEKRLAVLSTTGIAAGVGLLVGAGLNLLTNVSKQIPVLAGAATAVLTLALTLPSRLYKTNVNATVKEKEMAVFTADRELQKDLTQSVHQEVLDPNVSLDQKLNDNLKLRVANNAALVNFKL